MEKYGPFATIVAIALALVAMFSVFVVKMLGSIKKWTWLIDKPPSFMVMLGPRALAVAVMAVAYVVADKSNQGWSIAAAIACGVLCLLTVSYFDRQRRIHVVGIPLIGKDGRQLIGRQGPMVKNVVIGTEKDLRENVKRDYEKAQVDHGGISLTDFMGGYGFPNVNNPEALWTKDLLGRIGNRLTNTLTAIVLFAVLTLFLAALVVEIAQRPT